MTVMFMSCRWLYIILRHLCSLSGNIFHYHLFMVSKFTLAYTVRENNHDSYSSLFCFSWNFAYFLIGRQQWNTNFIASAVFLHYAAKTKFFIVITILGCFILYIVVSLTTFRFKFFLFSTCGSNSVLWG